jgi:adenylate cyclase
LRPPKGWHLRDDIQVVTDLAHCDESQLDYSRPIQVEGVLVDSEVSCRNTGALIRYLEQHLGVRPEPVLAKAKVTLPMAHLRDAHKWLSYAESLRVFDAIRGFNPSPNPRHFLEVGRHAHRWQSMGPGLDALANFIPLRTVMWLVADYNRVYNSGQFVRSIRKGHGDLTVISKYAQYVMPQAVVDQDFWTLGIYSGFPEKRGLPAAEAELQYTLFPLDRLLDREYAWLGIRDHGIRAEWTFHGLERRRWFVEGVEHAHEAILLKESLVEDGSWKGEDLFHPKPHDFEEFSAKDLTSLLEKRMACVVWRVTRTLRRGDEVVVAADEIWGAPYTRFRVRWPERSWWQNLSERVMRARKQIVVSQAALRDEIKAARDEAQQANRERKASERKSIIFQTYARRSLVDRIDRGEDPRTDRPVRKDMAVLFSDLRDFTGFASHMTPEDTVSFLNSYFNRLNRPIFRHGGEIDKIMGDGMMATFQEEDDLEIEVGRAVQAAVDIRLELQGYNHERWDWHAVHSPEIEFPRIDNGIGIAWGPVVTGNIGSDHKMDHTLIGDVVNVASRLEGLTRHYGSGILVTEEVRARLPDRFHVRFLDLARVKGRGEPVRIHEVFDHEPPVVQEAKLRWASRTTQAWDLYAAGLFSEAIRLYEEIRREMGPHLLEPERCMDPSIDFFLDRAHGLERRSRENPLLLDEWSGVHGFEAK